MESAKWLVEAAFRGLQSEPQLCLYCLCHLGEGTGILWASVPSSIVPGRIRIKSLMLHFKNEFMVVCQFFLLHFSPPNFWGLRESAFSQHWAFRGLYNIFVATLSFLKRFHILKSNMGSEYSEGNSHHSVYFNKKIIQFRELRAYSMLQGLEKWKSEEIHWVALFQSDPTVIVIQGLGGRCPGCFHHKGLRHPGSLWLNSGMRSPVTEMSLNTHVSAIML